MKNDDVKILSQRYLISYQRLMIQYSCDVMKNDAILMKPTELFHDYIEYYNQKILIKVLFLKCLLIQISTMLK